MYADSPSSVSNPSTQFSRYSYAHMPRRRRDHSNGYRYNNVHSERNGTRRSIPSSRSQSLTKYDTKRNQVHDEDYGRSSSTLIGAKHSKCFEKSTIVGAKVGFYIVWL